MVTTTTTMMMLMKKMFVLMMMLMMMVMSVGKAFPDKIPIKELLKDFQTIEVRANSEDSNILCKDDQLDIAFIIDTSRSIHAHEYDQQIEFVMKLVSIFNISPQNIRVAAISFGQEVVRDSAFGFSTYKTKEKVLAGIKGIVYRGRDMGDQTETGMAIAFARKNVFSNTRPGVKRICVVLTDGRSTDPLQTKQEASYARKDGIKMIAVGIGNNVSMEELKAIASNRHLVFKIDSYDLLPQFERHVMTQTCENLYNVVNDTEVIITDETPISMKITTTPKFEVEGPISMHFTTKPPIDTGEEGPISMLHTTTKSPSVDVTVTRPISDQHPCKDQLLDVNILFRPSRIPSRYVMKLIDKSISGDAMDQGITRVGVISIPKATFKETPSSRSLVLSNSALVMEYIPGKKLSEIIKSEKRGYTPVLAEMLISYVSRKCLSALAYLHERNIIHLDIKADNIFLTVFGNVKLYDFGLCVELKKPWCTSAFVRGTPNWVSPEVLQQRLYTSKSDIWSFGVTVVEMITGYPLNSTNFPNEYSMDSRNFIKLRFNGEHNLSTEIVHFLSLCLRIDYKQRPSTTELLNFGLC
ncbi:uncharacterized protein LOC106870666 [Octopus bimaculoides]|uniref:uncharacterized protein LOC106870666 n=1 Tax=Octopus bimaculoides TaxID=37653 RepID=UPI0022E073B2|nr:uncharacterized protein LOC106870666 [Octopus bimaculoides]